MSCNIEISSTKLTLASPIRAGFSVPVFSGDEATVPLASHCTKPYVPTNVDIEREYAVFVGLFVPESGFYGSSRQP